jgi:hypothetical protein
MISYGLRQASHQLREPKLMGYIRNYNKTATPIRWIYKNLDHRINPAAI